jgi:hypothetical protein
MCKEALMIKLPAEMVYYTEPQRSIETLLCWLPPDAYVHVSADADTLLRWYPDGLELSVDTDTLAEYDIDLGATPKDLHSAYQWLQAKGKLPSNQMVPAAQLQELAIKHGDGGLETGFDQPWSERNDLPTPPTVQESAMTAGDDAADVFARLSGHSAASRSDEATR